MCVRVCVLLMSVSQTVGGATGEMSELSHQAQSSAVNQSQGHDRQAARVREAVKELSPSQHIFHR